MPTPKRGRGRPVFKPTPALRKLVAGNAGGGMSREAIACALGISRTTLLKHFKEELTAGAHGHRSAVLQALERAALKGNVTACRAYLAFTSPDLEAVVPKADRAKKMAAPQPNQVKDEPQGKKAEAQAAGLVAQVGTEWEDLLKPPARLQ
ncbi:hypothetical protein [Variovorax paradoxus]|uniref:hypothetical protein n=1 Tax=Variovorax paradoxus TaxID=34073 RepID=UPI0030CAE84D